MSTAAINPKGPRVYAAGNTPAAWASTYLTSTVGQKILVGTTGLLLVGFLIGHMIGNLKVFSGPESLNRYAYFLKHDIGALLWIARAGLLALFVTHVVLALYLKRKAAVARPVGYHKYRTAQASLPSKTMLWTGLVTLAFTVFHLAHYTFGWAHGATLADGTVVNYLDLPYTLADGTVVHDVYRMVLAGFGTPWISALYVVCQLLLFIHLGHGIQSALQTLGLVGKRFTPAAKALGWAVAGTIFVGNLAIVVAVWAGYVK
jgi:succinate dehydrogenase / fumarate reductase cytochrome b subunit